MRRKKVNVGLRKLIENRGWTQEEACRELCRNPGFRRLSFRTFRRWIHEETCSLWAQEAVRVLSATPSANACDQAAPPAPKVNYDRSLLFAAYVLLVSLRNRGVKFSDDDKMFIDHDLRTHLGALPR